MGFAAGTTAGLAALGLDALLELLTNPSPFDPGVLRAEVFAVYAALGALAGLLVSVISTFAPRSPAPHDATPGRAPGPVFGWAMLLPYLIPVWERISNLVGNLPAAIMAVVGVGLWVVVLRSAAAGRLRWPVAALMAATTISLLLAMHRNLLPSPLAPEALLWSAAVVAAAAGLAFCTRSLTPQRAEAVLPLVLVAGLAMTTVGLRMTRHATPGVADGAAASRGLPHVFLLTVDTLRFDTFDDVTWSEPEGWALLDALDGARYFDRAHAPSLWTAPSMATLMTGLLPPEHGYGVRTGDDDRPLTVLSGELPTLAEGLAAHGYRTEAWVANPLLFAGSGIDRGFHAYHALEDSSRKLPWMRLFAVRQIHRASRQWLRRRPYMPAQRVADLVTRRVRRLDEPAEQPYFLWVHLMDPHAPYFRHAHLTESPDRRPGRYRGEVRYALRHAARMLDSWADAGLADETVMIFTSDHGEMFPGDRHREREFGRKGRERRTGHGHSLHREMTHVPLAIRAPAADWPESIDSRPVGLADLPPTLEDLLGISLGLPRTRWARSLARPLDGPESAGAERALLLSGNEWGPEQRGLVLDRWKLITYPGGEARHRVFDLEVDPKERQNLIRLRPERVEDLLRRLDEEWAEMRQPPATEAGEIDAETRQRLKALGYLQ